MLESIFATTTSTTQSISFYGLIIAMSASLFIGFLMSFVYRKTNKSTSSENFIITLVVLPMVVTIIILMIGNSVARAFSLAGAFTIIRFRSMQITPKDILYVLFSMAIGLAIGMGFVLYGIFVALIMCLVMIIIEITKYGQSTTALRLLKITIPENLDFESTFENTFNKYTSSYKLCEIKTDALGSLFKLKFEIVLKEDVNEKIFLDELRCRNGNLNISLNLDYQKELYL